MPHKCKAYSLVLVKTKVIFSYLLDYIGSPNDSIATEVFFMRLNLSKQCVVPALCKQDITHPLNLCVVPL